MIAFGPVPSRRLGYSLGINHIPPKHCTYSCVYCQVGRTTSLEITRREFFPPHQVIAEVGEALDNASRHEKQVDFLTLVPDGEPTLDIHLVELVQGLKKFGLPVAVITNSSLIDQQEVQQALLAVDWVSFKVDAVDEESWRKIDRPHGKLSLNAILNGMLEFRGMFQGELVTETMLISGINDTDSSLASLSSFLLALQPFKSYLAIPIRPPAEAWVKPPEPDVLLRYMEEISKRCPFIDLLFDLEEGDFSSTGDLIQDILGITAVHPMREDALRNMVEKAHGNWNVVESLVTSSKLICVRYLNENYFINRNRNSNLLSRQEIE